MKKHLFIIAFGLLLNKGIAQQITFEKSYSSINSLSTADISPINYSDTLSLDMPRLVNSFVQTADGGYVKLSGENSVTANLNVRMTKVDKFGKIIWEKIFGGAGFDIGKSIQKTSDGGFVFTGSTNSFGAGKFDMQLTKTDSLGNELWSKTFGGAENDYGKSVCETADGGFIIAGRTNSFGAGDMDIYVVRTTSNGSLLWVKTFGGAYEDRANSILQTPDGDFMIAGNTKSFGAGNTDIYVLKLDSNGNDIWERTFGELENETAEEIILTADSGLVITGSTSSFDAGRTNIYLAHLDINGNLGWLKTYGGTDTEGHSVQKTADGGYVVCGEINSGINNMDLALIKTDNGGNILWDKAYGGNGNEGGTMLLQTSDGGYGVMGTSENSVQDVLESYFVKTDANGNTTCHIDNTLLLTGDSVSFFTSAITPNISSSGMVILASSNDINTEILAPETIRVSCSGSVLTQADAYNNLTPDTTMITSPNVSDSTVGNFYASGLVSKALAPSALSSDIAFNVYPNPGIGADVKLAVHSSGQEEILVVVYDALGRENFSKVLVTEENSDNLMAIDPNGTLKPGVYMITATSQKNNFSRKLIIK